MEMKKITKEDMNPWDVSSIFHFTYYCCPECDWKDQNKQNFVNHAFTYHTLVSQCEKDCIFGGHLFPFLAVSISLGL